MRVEWTEHANRSLEFIFTCAQEYYPRTLLRKLNRELKRTEHLVANHPRMGGVEYLAEARDYEYRNIVLCKPFKLIYFIAEDTVFIADIWDTRREPNALLRNL